ncbi:MAG: hypothetical protein KJ077_12290 [Anaerolineae bacterium]|nr:hypothetical protein [Anaerolineae bacterium]
MRLQVRQTEDIENVLWAMQVVIQTTAASSEGSDLSLVYRRSFNHGFETAWQAIKTFFEVKPPSKKIWTAEEIKHLLETVQSRLVISANGAAAKYDNQGYYQGGEAACWCVATSFGLNLIPAVSVAQSLPPAFPAADSRVWFHEDVQNILWAVQTVIQITAAALENIARPAVYHEGFEAALDCAAKLFGIPLLSPTMPAGSRTKAVFWSVKDIEYKLRLVSQVMPAQDLATDEDKAQADIYRQGFKAALECMAASLGVRKIAY